MLCDQNGPPPPLDNRVTEMTDSQDDMVERTAEIVAAYLANAKVVPGDVPVIIETVFTALSNLSAPSAPAPETLTPAVPIKKSITPTALICLEDGRRFKTLKRHLKVAYDLSPDQYREKWGLPADYPMVAPAYAEARSQMAKSLGLGRKRAG
jgi:predicted transcriptional regulator